MGEVRGGQQPHGVMGLLCRPEPAAKRPQASEPHDIQSAARGSRGGQLTLFLFLHRKPNPDQLTVPRSNGEMPRTQMQHNQPTRYADPQLVSLRGLWRLL